MGDHQDVAQVSHFSEQSRGSTLNVEITLYDRKWFERFRRYRFWYVLLLNFDDGVDSTFFVNELLKVYQDALERIFVLEFQTIIDSVQLQQFWGENRVVQSDFIHFGMAHQDYVDYLYSSRLVKYSNVRFNEVIKT